MRSYGGLWREIVAPANLKAAWLRVRRNHAHSEEVNAFAADLDAQLSRLRVELQDGVYRPSGYRQFKIWDPKPRIISCAPVRDRIVHHALCAVIAPLLEASFVSSSYACRKGKGSHAACEHVQRLTREHPYFLKMDIRHYFDSIDHARLAGVILPFFREAPVRRLVATIVETYETEHGMGLPIGNLTSQWFANAYLNALDHLLSERLGVRFVRYMDDVIVFARSKALCWRVHDAVAGWLQTERGLALKDEATIVAPVRDGVPFLGLRIFPSCWRLQHGRLFRTRRRQRLRERQFLCGRLSLARLTASARAMDGCARWFGFRSVLRRAGEAAILATEERAASGSNRNNRGGSWNNDAGNAASSNRNNNNPSNRNNNLGFRLFSTVNRGTLSNSVSPAPDGLVGTNNAGGESSGKRQTPPTDDLPLFYFLKGMQK